VAEPRTELVILGNMPLRLHHIVIDAHDLPTLARFWADALGWTVLSTREREVIVGASADAPVGLCFMPAGPTRKSVKNRLHLDLTTTAQDRDVEIERLLGLGARRVDVGQSEQDSWEVLADPEGNEFCVVQPRTSLVG
jgi:predicted enzyme related to lactoylglutathione lyase